VKKVHLSRGRILLCDGLYSSRCVEKPGKIQVQGHTDNIPIRSARYRSNWELSTARAVSVAQALMDADVNPKRF
jgi:flagellar motor protein MotB